MHILCRRVGVWGSGVGVLDTKDRLWEGSWGIGFRGRWYCLMVFALVQIGDVGTAAGWIGHLWEMQCMYDVRQTLRDGGGVSQVWCDGEWCWGVLLAWFCHVGVELGLLRVRWDRNCVGGEWIGGSRLS